MGLHHQLYCVLQLSAQRVDHQPTRRNVPLYIQKIYLNEAILLYLLLLHVP
jgi:hypothetical protein